MTEREREREVFIFYFSAVGFAAADSVRICVPACARVFACVRSFLCVFACVPTCVCECTALENLRSRL